MGRDSSKTMPGSDTQTAANFSESEPANNAHFPPYECPTTPIRFGSTSGRCASQVWAFAATYAR